MEIEISIDEYVGRIVKEARQKAGIEQKELAKAMGMSPMNLSHLERGKRHWKLRDLEKFVKTTGVEISLTIN